MISKKIIADYKSEDGKWRHNEHILCGEYEEDLTDEHIVIFLERQMAEHLKMGVACVLFCELYDPDNKIGINELTAFSNKEKEFHGVMRMVIADEDLYSEWIKPEGM